MNPFAKLARHPALLRFKLPVVMLITLLQRSPVARLLTASADCFGGSGSGGFVLKSSVAAVAALGAVDTLAGATTYALQATQGSPVTLTLNQKISPIAFTVTNTINIGSWNIMGPIPPGLAFTALEGGGTVSGSGGVLDATSPGEDDGYGGTTGGNAQTTPVLSGTPTAAGTYNIQITAYEFGAEGGLVSPTYTFQIVVPSPVVAVSFSTQPQNQTVTAGANVTFTVAVSDPSAAIQWQFNGSAISGATSATLNLTNVAAANSGTYTATATNAAGTVTSSTATLTVNPAPTKPAFVAQPASQTVLAGGTAVFSAAVTGATSYQWQRNGANLSGATSALLVVTNAGSSNTGAYTLTATNSVGSVTSNPVTLATSTSSNFGRLINLSVLTTAGSSDVLTVGFTSGGAGTSGQESLLIRGMGPSLATVGLPAAGLLPDPTLTVISQSTHATVTSDDNWGSAAANVTAVDAADSATGAFPPASTTSLDAALVTTLPEGGYSVQISGNGAATGTALAEVYDNPAAGAFTPASPRLTNVSCLSTVSGSGTLIAGFTITGNTNRSVLIRATGPALATLGLQGTMPDPQIVLASTSTQTTLASNAGWGGDPQIVAVSAAVQAFALTNTSSKDSVLLMTLPPGGYSATASSVSGSGGQCLIEVYEVP